jgi:hypothetical protein
MIKYKFHIGNDKLKKKHLHIWNELLIHAIENKPDKQGMYSIPLSQVLAHGVTQDELGSVLESLAELQIEWKLVLPVNGERVQAKLLSAATVLRNEVKFRFYKHLISSIVNDPHFFALMKSYLNKVSY